jgi:glyoxylase-like metal-dependent hydrolase (beta-lactamase superfamily II)
MNGKIISAICIFLIAFPIACSREEGGTSELVQPDQWWNVHPRPVYSTLERMGTYQSWFDVYKLAPGTYAIYEPNQFEEAICYVVEGEDRAVLIDAGTGIGNLKQVVEQLTSLPVSVVLTHEHYDHVGSAHLFREVALYDDSIGINVLRNGVGNERLQGYVTEEYLWKPLPEGFDPAAWTIPPVMPTTLYHEGDTIDLGDRVLEVIYTPGHSPGSMCLLDSRERLLFTGDVFFPGPLYAHPADVNIDDYRKSIDKLAARVDEYDYICSGHNDPWVKGEVMLRVKQAFKTIFDGEGNFSEDNGLRRYHFDGFDILIRTSMIQK